MIGDSAMQICSLRVKKLSRDGGGPGFAAPPFAHTFNHGFYRHFIPPPARLIDAHQFEKAQGGLYSWAVDRFGPSDIFSKMAATSLRFTAAGGILQ
jgi:hypothetical protein